MNFKALGIQIRDPIHSLRDDGFVENIREHEKKSFGSMGLIFDGSKKLAGGYYKIQIPGVDRVDHIICYEDQKNYLINLSIQSHEETHALHASLKLNILENLINEGSVNFKFGRLWDPDSCSLEESEYVADIGACYAFHSRGISLGYLGNRGVNFSWKALQDYKEALKGKEIICT